MGRTTRRLMDLGLSGKVAWVTGASSGLGRGAAASLAREGAAVAISSRDAERLRDAAREITDAGGRCIPVVCDVTDPEAISAAAGSIADDLGPVDILVSNAGGPPPGTFETLSYDELHTAFELTTSSAWRLTEAVMPTMKERGGVLIYVTSSSVIEALPNLLLSNMMRRAVVGMAKTIATELGPDGIRAICVAPGAYDTARRGVVDEAAAASRGRKVDEIRADTVASIPLRRYGGSDEFGDVVAFLASERASFVTGTTILIDGGAGAGY